MHESSISSGKPSLVVVFCEVARFDKFSLVAAVCCASLSKFEVGLAMIDCLTDADVLLLPGNTFLIGKHCKLHSGAEEGFFFDTGSGLTPFPNKEEHVLPDRAT